MVKKKPSKKAKNKKLEVKNKKKEVKLTEKGIIITHYLKKKENKEKKGEKMSYLDIAKDSGFPKSTVYYYHKRPNHLYEKKGQNYPKSI